MGTCCYTRRSPRKLLRETGEGPEEEDAGATAAAAGGARRKARGSLWAEARARVVDIISQWAREHPEEVVLPDDHVAGHRSGVGRFAGIPTALPDDLVGRCEDAVRRVVGADGAKKERVANFVAHVRRGLLESPGPAQFERTAAEWRAIFPRYPTLDDGFVQSFDPHDAGGIRGALAKYGVCVVRVLERSECDQVIAGMFEEINALRQERGVAQRGGPPIAPDDPASWETKNWPSKSKFLVPRVALHPAAFATRVSPLIHTAFAAVFGDPRLHVTVDNWGVIRGCAGQPEAWAAKSALMPHWDLNPWSFVADMERGEDPGYQGLVALTDQTEETGCHRTLPGCTQFCRQWCRERPRPASHKRIPPRTSHRPAADDPVIAFMQPIPLRAGEMVIWSWGQLHGSLPSQSRHMRLHMFVRMYPAPEAVQEANPGGAGFNYEGHDRYGCVKVLQSSQKKGDLTEDDVRRLRGHLTPLGHRLLGFERWPAEGQGGQVAGGPTGGGEEGKGEGDDREGETVVAGAGAGTGAAKQFGIVLDFQHGSLAE